MYEKSRLAILHINDSEKEISVDYNIERIIRETSISKFKYKFFTRKNDIVSKIDFLADVIVITGNDIVKENIKNLNEIFKVFPDAEYVLIADNKESLYLKDYIDRNICTILSYEEVDEKNLIQAVVQAGVKKYLKSKVDICLEHKRELNFTNMFFNMDDPLTQILENINEYIYSVRYKNREVVSRYHSPICYNVTGYTSEELIDNPDLWFEMIYDDDKVKVKSFIEKVIHTIKPGIIEHRIVKKDGAIAWVSNSCNAMADRSGDVEFLHGFLLDITGRKLSEEKLLKMSIAVESNPAVVVVTDANGLIEDVNPKFTSITGYSYEEAIGKNPRVLKSGSQDKDFYKKMWDTILSGKEWSGEFHNRKKDGNYYWENASISPVFSENGVITHFVAVKEDITEKKLAYEALEISEEKLRRKNEIFEKDMALSQIIHKSLLPEKAPELETIETAFRFLPLDKVGGDFFSFNEVNDDFLSVLIADVAGHGISAALFISLVKSTSDWIFKKHSHAPGEYLREMSKALLDTMPSYFLTSIYGYFDFTNGVKKFIFANGAHPYPIVNFKKDNSFRQVKSSGTIVGIIENGKYKNSIIKLESGDRIFLFTDGVPETENPKKEIIGFDSGLLELFCDTRKDSLEDTLDALIDELQTFIDGASFGDDILVIGFEVK